MKKQDELKNTLKELMQIISQIDSPEILEKLFTEILTPSELDDVTLRWQLLKELYSGDTQRAIASKHSISLCKITRGSKLLKDRSSIINNLLKKHYGEENG